PCISTGVSGTESFVIALLGAAANQPRGPWLACQLQGYQEPVLYTSA
ncbi:transposase, partial [Synechococcus sp. B60.1]